MDWLVLLLIVLILMLITATKTCAVKNDRYVVKGHQENAVLLHNISEGLETFSNKVEHFFETQSPNGALTAILGVGGKETEVEKKIAEAKAEKELAGLQADKARADLAAANAKAETEDAKAHAAAAQATAEGFINYYY
jgi:hypothetical protein